jgi:hypothetical protein
MLEVEFFRKVDELKREQYAIVIVSPERLLGIDPRLMERELERKIQEIINNKYQKDCDKTSPTVLRGF